MSRLRGQPELVGYAEDIALGVFNSLCIGAERGRFPNLSNRRAIWQLLAVMTVRKTIDLHVQGPPGGASLPLRVQ